MSGMWRKWGVEQVGCFVFKILCKLTWEIISIRKETFARQSFLPCIDITLENLIYSIPDALQVS